MESTLALKKADFDADVGFFLGYGRGLDGGDVAWTTAQAAAIDACIRSGLRQFYFPPPVAGVTGGSHEWSFLKPQASLTLSDGVDSVDLPDDFGSLHGSMSVETSGSVNGGLLANVNESRVTGQRASAPASGRPYMAAVVPVKGTATTAGQRFRLEVYPTPDGDHTVRLSYTLLPDALTGARPYCLGGAEHAETIREACLAAAETYMDDGEGVHAKKFLERLAASISMDRGKRPATLGYNGNGPGRDDPLPRRYGVVTVNGVTP